MILRTCALEYIAQRPFFLRSGFCSLRCSFVRYDSADLYIIMGLYVSIAMAVLAQAVSAILVASDEKYMYFEHAV